MSPHISIKGEVLFSIAGFPVTNSLMLTWIVIVIFFIFASTYHAHSMRRDKSLFYYAVNSVLKMLFGLFHSVLRDKLFTFFALLGAFFFFILFNNWSGLIPGVGSILFRPQVHESQVIRPELDQQEAGKDQTSLKESEPSVKEIHKVPLFRGGTADLNTTIALAFLSVVITQIYGFKFLGAKSHLGKYFNFKNPVLLFVGILELILEGARILSFSFRLFGNIFAGEVLLTVVPFLLPAVLSFVSSPMFMMEIFVGIVQALVFTMLSAVFINMAVSHH